MVTFKEFTQLDIRTGKVIEVSDHPDADKLYVLKVDIGEEAIQLVAGLKGHYSPEQLQGKTIVVLANLEPKALRGVISQGMLLAARAQGRVRILTCDEDLTPGSVIG